MPQRCIWFRPLPPGPGLVLGQRATAEKSNEITAIPELLSTLALTGCTVTIDAMGTQTAIAEAIRERGADYVLAVKDNQPKLAESIEDFWRSFRAHPASHTPHSFAETVEKDHGRLETRRCYVFDQLECLEKPRQWPGLRCFAVLGIGADHGRQNHPRTAPLHQQPGRRCPTISRAIRSHWSVENRLHWSWMCRSTTTRCAPEPKPPLTTWPCSNTSPSILSGSIRSNEKAASKPEDSSPQPPDSYRAELLGLR
jgi:predicted transposase YbfD/YdcC